MYRVLLVRDGGMGSCATKGKWMQRCVDGRTSVAARKNDARVYPQKRSWRQREGVGVASYCMMARLSIILQLVSLSTDLIVKMD